jgi:hypothetical protein
MPYLTGHGYLSQADYDKIKGVSAGSDTGTNEPVATTTQTQATPGTTTSSTSGPIPYEGVSSADLGTTPYIAPGAAQDPNSGISSADLGTTATIARDPNAGLSSADTGETAYIAPKKPGNTTNDDASTNNTKSGTDRAFNAATNPSNPITPSPNILDQFASYTYNLSWYLLTPQQANVLASTSKINTNEWSLLVRSGGSEPPVVPAAPGPATATPPATQTKPVTATYKPDGTVDAYNAAGYQGG